MNEFLKSKPDVLKISNAGEELQQNVDLSVFKDNLSFAVDGELATIRSDFIKHVESAFENKIIVVVEANHPHVLENPNLKERLIKILNDNGVKISGMKAFDVKISVVNDAEEEFQNSPEKDKFKVNKYRAYFECLI